MATETTMGPRARAISALVKRHFQELDKKGKLSGAHSFGHVARVGSYAAKIARALGADKETAELTHIAGLLHDFVRNKAETIDPALDDEVLAAQQAKPLLEGLGEHQKDGRKLFSSRDVDVITAAIKTHTVPKDLLKTEDRHEKPTGEKLVRLAVWLADKTEANGSFVVARRGQFVAGERYHAEKRIDKVTGKTIEGGDLREWREKLLPALQRVITPHVAFLMESYIRRYLKNDSARYPRWFRHISNPLFAQQRQFVVNLHAATGLTEEDIERLILVTKYPGTTKEQVRAARTNRPKRNDKITEEEIRAVPRDEAKAAVSLVDHFAHEKHRGIDTAGAIMLFKPKNEHERQWHGLMREYLAGRLNKAIQRIREHV